MRQVIAREVEAPLAERLLSARIVSGDTVRLGVHDGTLHFERVSQTNA
jgi:ATP-dependent Clp protease ATP-binding subunit ClpA